MHYVFILGRQPELGRFELERVFGNVQLFSDSTALVSSQRTVDIEALGGSIKAGRVVERLQTNDWQTVVRRVSERYARQWNALDHKQTVGISVHDWGVSAKQVTALGLSLKKAVKATGTSLRLIPNKQAALGSATSHHNKLGLSPAKTELLIIKHKQSVLIAESVGAQNITALAARDQARPKTDAFVGMLPPKLALMMLNFSGIRADDHATGPILDPFCGTGVVLQEAALRGFDVYGSDLSQKMVDYSTENLAWLGRTRSLGDVRIELGDATDHIWRKPIGAVVSETYLGQPFSAPPSPAKLEQVRGGCDRIVTTFLANLHPQLAAGTPLSVAVPAWRGRDGQFTQLPLTRALGTLGYESMTDPASPLLYYRENQVVARQLLVLTRR